MSTSADLQITKISINNLNTTNSLKASVDIEFNGLLTIKGFKIFDGSKGMFLGMPSRKAGDNWEDIAVFSNSDVQRLVSDAVIKQYGGTPSKSAGRSSAFTPQQAAQLAAAKTGGAAPVKKTFGKPKGASATELDDNDMPDYASTIMNQETIFDD